MIRTIRRSISKLVAAHRSRAARQRVNIDLSDLLGRAPVNLSTPELQRFLAGKVVLVSGAGGSIGSEIARQCMKFCPSRLVLLDRAENALFEIDRELNHRWVAADVVPVVADVCDADRVNEVFQSHRPHVIFHAAAHKHVPMMEHNPGEAVKNNVFGTKIVADAAAACSASAFVMVSTDKAVNPTSVMGASKRVAELYVQSLNELPGRKRENGSRTRFLVVRFGNVLGSSGSVVPIFQKQIDAGGPITVTHPEMRRYFMTIPEASQLVMQAGAIGDGGEIFVLDMGAPVRILDLALELIDRRGLRAGDDIQIEFTGVRPGEKLYEELAFENERTKPTSHEKIRVWQLAPAGTTQVKRMPDLLSGVIGASRQEIVFALAECVPEYRPDTSAFGGVPDQATKLRLLAASIRPAQAA
jgi:FlaA1/EpsC-like NDP-sugar epimerase